MHHRNILIALALAGAGLALPAAPAHAVDSATCTGSGDAHAGRQFTLSARTEPITGDFSYAFDLDNNSSYETVTGTESSVRTEQKTAGTYTYGVSVTDNEVPAGDPKREARGTCQVTVVNDLPSSYFEMHPVTDGPGATAYEATRFTFRADDSEDDLNQVAMTHSFDFDGDGQLETTRVGHGEIFTSFPAGFDKDVTHRVTDAAGGWTEKKLRVTTKLDPFGIGGNAVLAALGIGELPKVTAAAPKSIKRKTLLKGGLKATFNWGPHWGRVELTPRIGKKSGFNYVPDGGYAPGQRLTVKPFPPQLKRLARPGKKIQLRWTAKGKEGAGQTGTLTVKIKR